MNSIPDPLWSGSPKNYAQEQKPIRHPIIVSEVMPNLNTPTPRPDPIPEQTATLQRNLDDLHKALDLLTDKLGSVISSAEDPKTQGPTTDSYGSSALAIYLHSLGCSIASATERIHALTRRI
ncbi:MAG: hypothetical protein ACRC1H_13560, partial [Caldilineaceae bacterium]